MEKIKTEKLFQYEDVPETPFTIVEQEGKYHVMCGIFRINAEPLNSKKECEPLMQMNWQTIIALIETIISKNEKFKKDIKELLKNNENE